MKPLPTPGTTPGPDWANQLNAAISELQGFTPSLLLEPGASVPAQTSSPALIYQKPASTDANYDSLVIGSGPAVYHTLHDTSGTSLADSSGNSHPATISGGYTLADTTDPAAPTIVGGHVRFDGTSGVITLDAATTWFTPATAGFTFAGWFYVRSWANWARFFDFANAANAADMYFGANNVGSLSLYVNGTRLDMARFSLNAWHHVGCTVTVTGAATIYVDGASWFTGTVGAPVNQARAYKYIGQSASAADPHLSASVAKIAIWNSVLNGAQMARLAGANSGSAAGWWDGSTIQPLG